MNNLPELRNGALTLIVAPHALSREWMTAFTAQLALSGEVRVLDGGNRFAAYLLARMVRRYTAQLEETLARVRVARAFTCFQMAALLRQAGDWPAPTLVLELLSTFLDENVNLLERRYLLKQTLNDLQRLRSQAPVAISCTPPGPDQPAEFLESLREQADEVLLFEPPEQQAQLRLF